MDLLINTIEIDPSCCCVATTLDNVLNSECCYTFYNPYHEPDGIVVNLKSFLGTIPELALACNKHKLFVRICKKRILKEEIKSDEVSNDCTPSVTKLAIGGEGGFKTDADKYETISKYSVVVFNSDGTIGAELPYTDETKRTFPEIVVRSVDSIINHAGILTQQQIDETWQDEPIPVSKFANESLPFVDNGVTISPRPSDWKCEKTGATENLWLNLSDGYIGGGRKHWDGSGGSNGALDHYNETGKKYPLVVKLGTITSDIDSADCYSYDPSEDGPVKVPNLAEILQRRGIYVGSLSKTVKSTAELEVELNANYAFDAITESGLELQVVSGPSLQGLQNLGNSCYMNSVVQCLFTIPELANRYGAVPVNTKEQLLQNPFFVRLREASSNSLPTTDVLSQTIKLAMALTTGLYTKPVGENDDLTNEPIYRLAPRMFKHCIGKDHVDFKTAQQQDAAQYYQHVLQKLDQAEMASLTSQQNPSPLFITSHLFSYTTTNRVVCNIDGKVKYRSNDNATETILSLRIPMDKASLPGGDDISGDVITSPDQKRLKSEDGTMDDTNPQEEKIPDDSHGTEAMKPIPTVSLLKCFEEWGTDITVEGIQWQHLSSTASASQRTFLSNFPRYLMVQVQRYELGPDWQPRKLEVNVDVPDEIDLTQFKSMGPQVGEDIVADESNDNEGIITSTNTGTTLQPVIDEGALGQLLDMGFQMNSCKRALIAVGGTDIEAAMAWIFEHNVDPDFNDPVPEGNNDHASTPATINNDDSVVQSLVESLGCFSPDQVRFALSECNNVTDRAADFLFSHMDELDMLMAKKLTTASSSDPQTGNQCNRTKVQLEDSDCGKYELLGMISHIGKNTSSGHYVAHLKKTIDGDSRWVIFNDEKVALSSNPPRQHAYLYLFRRSDTITSPHPSY